MGELIIPDWPAPASVHAVITTRRGGFSMPPFDGFNLGAHVGDDAQAVVRNRELLHQRAGLPNDPCWLSQVHGCGVVQCDTVAAPMEGDAATTGSARQVCAVLTADCLPLLICNRTGTRVAAVHAGWRGLSAGVIEATLACFREPGSELLVWLGPAIGPAAFEVGDEVRDAFAAQDSNAVSAFTAARPGHWMADIYQLARQRLDRLNVGYVGGGDYCTLSDSKRFFSYRRDGDTGRMASLIWLN